MVYTTPIEGGGPCYRFNVSSLSFTGPGKEYSRSQDLKSNSYKNKDQQGNNTALVQSKYMIVIQKRARLLVQYDVVQSPCVMCISCSKMLN